MKRRTFLPAAAAASAGAAGLSAAQGGAAASRHIIELRRYQLRTNADNQNQRLSEFLGKVYFPAIQRAGAATTSAFGSVIAEQSPFVMTAVSYPSMAAYAQAHEKIAMDAEYAKASDTYFKTPGLAFMRIENSLLRGFRTMPSVEVPSNEGRTAPRVFELRVYESNNPETLARKIKMFDEGEIDIFRRTGLQPVFFGETIVGRNMPNLTYLLAFDDLAAREKNWRTFVSHPDWKKLAATPGYADAEIVSNISNAILRPLAFSAIR
ncbi:MAG TPA: NIPSNAP family containing protein [Solibacterales bacterium]|nr:NIPSNAP family containing protein [Bryobacterales bacterium]